MIGRRHLRSLVAVLAGLLVAVLLAGCSGGRPEARSFPKRPTTGLASLLEKPPEFTAAGSSTWAGDYTPSVSQYLAEFYAPKARAEVRATLQQQGLQEIAHVLWVTDDQIQNDIVLLRFDSAAGAAQRLAFATSTNEGSETTPKSYRIDAPASPVVFYSDGAVKDDYYLAKAYAQVGAYVVEMFVYAPGQVPRELIARWFNAQVAALA